MYLPAKPVETTRKKGEFQYLHDIVHIGYSVQDAQTYLSRHLGNPVSLRLVELLRGEELGVVRQIQVLAKSGGTSYFVRLHRMLPDGSEASFFAPPNLVRTEVIVEDDDGQHIRNPVLHSQDEIRLFVPVRSYLQFLPGIYRGNTPMARRDIMRYDERAQRQLGMKDKVRDEERVDSNAMRQFLLLFQQSMLPLLDHIDEIPNLTNPMNVHPKFLSWLASWVDFHLDASLPIHQQRELVRRAIRLQRSRGTVAGVANMIRILTAAPVTIIEREKPRPLTLGQMTLSGGGSVDKRFLRKEPTPHYCIPMERRRVNFFIIQLEDATAFRNRFGERAPSILRKISQVVTREMPAHVQFTIQFADGGSIIPVQRLESPSKDISLTKDSESNENPQKTENQGEQRDQGDNKREVRTSKISRSMSDENVDSTSSKKVVTRTISRSMSREDVSDLNSDDGEGEETTQKTSSKKQGKSTKKK